jgi:hypothetical protein
MVKNGQKLPHDGQKCPKITACWLKMAKNYCMMVKNVQKQQHDGQKWLKLTHDGQKCLKTSA